MTIAEKNKNIILKWEKDHLLDLRKRSGLDALRLCSEPVVISGNQVEYEGETLTEIMLIPRGEFRLYGEAEISRYDDYFFDNMIASFVSRVRGQDIPLDYDHWMAEAAGWIRMLIKKNDGLYGLVKFTPEGQRCIDEGEYRYGSVAYLDEYTNPATGAQGKCVLISHALTNYPALKGIAPYSQFSEKHIIFTRGEITPETFFLTEKKDVKAHSQVYNQAQSVNINNSLDPSDSNDCKNDKSNNLNNKEAKKEMSDELTNKIESRVENVEKQISEANKKAEEEVKSLSERLRLAEEKSASLMAEQRMRNIKDRCEKWIPTPGKDTFLVRKEELPKVVEFAETLSEEQFTKFSEIVETAFPGTKIMLGEIGTSAGGGEPENPENKMDEIMAEARKAAQSAPVGKKEHTFKETLANLMNKAGING